MRFKRQAQVENVYFQKKIARFGLKFSFFCEAESGHISDFLIYTSDEIVYNLKYSQYPVFTKLVLYLMDRSLGKGYCVSINNFYMSSQLADILVTEKTDSYGAVNKTRKRPPRQFSKDKVPKGEISKKTVMKPVVIYDFNNTMDGLDLCDQEMFYYPTPENNRGSISKFSGSFSINRTAYVLATKSKTQYKNLKLLEFICKWLKKVSKVF
ncbi:piggyBac transposable element-derived protein 4 [Caerostris extrusa]|uniref:PiggyBac transposable element-derived protein 4 n=1 Tax=Caerostris extrusa TaxID=172846 RepID=A0AAV4SDF3_CAEEX|nr:piggyBac transposable element-derived protein 4 [Caerostris extrusa]